MTMSEERPVDVEAFWKEGPELNRPDDRLATPERLARVSDPEVLRALGRLPFPDGRLYAALLKEVYRVVSLAARDRYL